MYLFTKRLNLPVVSWGLGHGSGAQSKDEHMLIEAAGPMKDLAGAEKGFADFLYAFAQG